MVPFQKSSLDRADFDLCMMTRKTGIHKKKQKVCWHKETPTRNLYN